VAWTSSGLSPRAKPCLKAPPSSIVAADRSARLVSALDETLAAALPTEPQTCYRPYTFGPGQDQAVTARIACNAGDAIMSKLVLMGLLFGVLTVPPARAQVTIDVAKITCEQFVSWSITDPRYVILWLHGYHNGKRDNTLIDQETLKEDAAKVRTYCSNNRARTVMQAVESVGFK
jgi:hypothetical protein